MQSKHSQSGFTLIELLVVIVILGILAAIALPKFIGLSTDARVSVVNSMDGAVTEAASLVHALAEIHDQTGATGSVTLPDGTTISTVYGYPYAGSSGIAQALQDYASTPNTSFPFTLVYAGGTDYSSFEYATGGTPNANCSVTYDEPISAGQAATVGDTTTGC